MPLRDARKAASRLSGRSGYFSGKKQPAPGGGPVAQDEVLAPEESPRTVTESATASEPPPADPEQRAAASEPPPADLGPPRVLPVYSDYYGGFLLGSPAADTELRQLRDERMLLFGSEACQYQCGDGALDGQIIRESLVLYATVLQEKGAAGPAVKELDRRFQEVRGALMRARSGTPEQGKLASAEVAAGLALINGMLSHSIALWEADKDDPAKYDPTPEQLAGYITFAWSQMYWAFVPAAADTRHRTAESIRSAINGRLLEFSGHPGI